MGAETPEAADPPGGPDNSLALAARADLTGWAAVRPAEAPLLPPTPPLLLLLPITSCCCSSSFMRPVSEEDESLRDRRSAAEPVLSFFVGLVGGVAL